MFVKSVVNKIKRFDKSKNNVRTESLLIGAVIQLSTMFTRAV